MTVLAWSGMAAAFCCGSSPTSAGLRICPALAFFGSQVGQSRRVLLPLGMAVDHRIIQDGGIDPVDPRPGHLPGVKAARQGDGLGRSRVHREPAGAVPFPEHDDVRPEKRVIRPVGPADLDHLCFHPVWSCLRRHCRHLPVSQPRRPPCQRRQTLGNLAVRAGWRTGITAKSGCAPGRRRAIVTAC